MLGRDPPTCSSRGESASCRSRRASSSALSPRVRAPRRHAPRGRRPGRRGGAALEVVELDPDRPAAPADLLEGHAPAGQGRAGARPRPAGARARRAAHRPRPPPAAAHDRAVPRLGARASASSSRATSSTRSSASARVLVIAQGRLAAEGDFHAIRDLMDDRRRAFARTDDSPGWTSRLISGTAWRSGAFRRATDHWSSTPTDVAALRQPSPHRPHRQARLYEVHHPRRGPRERVPLPARSARSPGQLRGQAWRFILVYSLILRTQTARAAW